MRVKRKFFRQWFCRHDFLPVARGRITTSNLWQCNKCNLYHIQHNSGLETRTTGVIEDHWDFYKNNVFSFRMDAAKVSTLATALQIVANRTHRDKEIIVTINTIGDCVEVKSLPAEQTYYRVHF